MIPFLTSCGDYIKITKLKTGQAYIIIYAERFYEARQAIFYDIIKNGEIIQPKYLIGTNSTELNPDYLQFQLISSPNKEIIGVIEKGNPRIILCMYNLKTDECWPNGKAENRGIKLLKNFNKNEVGHKYKIYECGVDLDNTTKLPKKKRNKYKS